LQAETAAVGANAVVAIDLDYEVAGADGSMLMVSASGTAVRVKRLTTNRIPLPSTWR
jgi:uncharacterized protein YbjQ (UPF0145 family)